MRTRLLIGLGLLALLTLLAAAAVLLDPTRVLLGTLWQEPFYQQRPASYWSQALQDPAPAARTNTIKTLADGGAAAVPLLTDLLAARRPADVRLAAAEALGLIGPEAKAAVPALAAALGDSDRFVRVAAADALGKIG